MTIAHGRIEKLALDTSSARLDMTGQAGAERSLYAESQI